MHAFRDVRMAFAQICQLVLSKSNIHFSRSYMLILEIPLYTTVAARMIVLLANIETFVEIWAFIVSSFGYVANAYNLASLTPTSRLVCQKIPCIKPLSPHFLEVEGDDAKQRDIFICRRLLGYCRS